MLKMNYLDLLRNVTVPMPVYVYLSTHTYTHSFFYR